MELLKKNIHMDRIRTEASNQIALEDDINIPENKQDVSALNLEKGKIVIEEVKPGTDEVTVRGRLFFAVLYHTTEEGSRLVNLEGKISFEEKLHLQGVTSADAVTVSGEVEDLSVNVINSRKLNVQSVVTLNAQVEELYDEEVPIGVHGEENIEYHKVPMDLAQIAISKNDIFRMKEEITLPSNYTNIYQILWDYVSLGDVEFKLLEEKITIQGDIHFFLLYEGEGEEHPVQTFETTIPFSGVLECHGCREGMLPDIRYALGQQDISIRPDFDGEERNIGLELALDIGIRIYEEEKTELISDIYGVTKEIQAATQIANLRKLLSRVTGKTKVTDHIRIKSGNAGILQVLHSEGRVIPTHQEVVDNGILLHGILFVKVMYIAGDDEKPYAATQAQIPYHYTLDVPDIAPADMGKVHAQVEQLQVTMLDGEEMDVKAILTFTTTIFKSIPIEVISQVNVSDLDTVSLGDLPGMVIYTVKSGDNLWNIGKKYYVSVASLKELNELTSDELNIGQKLLIVKGA